MLEGALLVAVLVLTAISLLSWAGIHQLTRQQGRLLLRLDDLERRLARHDHTVPTSDQLIAAGLDPTPAVTTRRGFGQRPLSLSRIERDGLEAGTPAPPFELPEIGGGTVSLDDYRGRQILLVFMDPHCGPCEHLAPHLARLHDRHGGASPAIVVVGRGDPDENRRKAETYGFGFPVVLQKRWELSRQYGIFATPVAFWIDEKGVITRNVASGLDEVLALAHEAFGAEGERRDGHAV